MRYSDQALPWTLVGLAAFIFWRAIGLRIWDPLGPGPGFFPMILSGLLGILALSLVGRGRSGAGAHSDSGVVPDEEGAASGGDGTASGRRRIGLLFALLTGYLLALLPLGFLVATTLFLLALLRTLERRRWLEAVVVSLAISGIATFMFSELLGVRLPTGILG